MFDVSNKTDTLRRAIAQAIIRTKHRSTIKLVKEGKSPKGDVIEAAKLSGTMAAKKTSDLIPYCHPIPIDYVKVDTTLNEESIIVKTEVKSVWKTGVEMESLMAAGIAALTIYDMLKPVDDSLSIESIALLEKSGGIKELYKITDTVDAKRLKAAVLVTSDTRKKKADQSGKIILDRLRKNNFDVVDYKVIADDADRIESELRRFADDLQADLVITSGGTGLGSRDVTPEATAKIIEKEMGGVSEALRAFGQKRTPLSMLSRGIAGVRKNTVIVNLPGSSKAVSESLDLLFPSILHVYSVLSDNYKHPNHLRNS